MRGMPDNYVDLVVTSPPYDNLRKYNGYSFDFLNIASELYRVIKDGGTMVWVVGDQTKNGNESGTSFKQAITFQNLGFNLHDTMIYSKCGQGATGSNLAYWQDFEYMFVLTKGKIKTFNPIEDRKNVVKPRTSLQSQGHRTQDGKVKTKRVITRKEYGRRTNIWIYHESNTRTLHPAVFPLQLAKDHITSWSNEGDLVYDPFMGSGTVAKACVELNRRWIGSEISEEYCQIIKNTII